MLGAALLVVAPSVGKVAAGGGLAGPGGIAAHLRYTIPKDTLEEVSQLLESGASSLLLVAIDRKGIEISPLLERAEKAVVVETKTGDLDAAFYGALRALRRRARDTSVLNSAQGRPLGMFRSVYER